MGWLWVVYESGGKRRWEKAAVVEKVEVVGKEGKEKRRREEWAGPRKERKEKKK